MVIKMKMFGFFDNSQIKKQVKNQFKNIEQQSSLSPSSSQFNMKNIAATMKIQNTGCKSCTG